MKFFTHILMHLLLLIGVAPLAQAQLQRLESEHAAFWNEAFATIEWKSAAIGFVIVKQTMKLHVVRLSGTRDTVTSFPVCMMSSTPGFKVREGDGRTPEGIYHISLLNPASSYHLSMKINYPNAIDDARHLRHTRAAGERWSQGGDIFIHGKCVSIGCVAMTDEIIEKLYLLIAARPSRKQNIPVLILPYDDEAQYQQMFFHADEQYEETNSIYWLLLRNHLDNMRNLWRHFRSTGEIPAAAPTTAGLYNLEIHE
jgi:murein L,D-transpeptidase YafK